MCFHKISVLNKHFNLTQKSDLTKVTSQIFQMIWPHKVVLRYLSLLSISPLMSVQHKSLYVNCETTMFCFTNVFFFDPLLGWWPMSSIPFGALKVSKNQICTLRKALKSNLDSWKFWKLHTWKIPKIKFSYLDCL